MILVITSLVGARLTNRWDWSDGRFVAAARHLATLQAEQLLGDVAACNFDAPHLQRLLDAGLPIVANQVCGGVGAPTYTHSRGQQQR